MVASPSKCHSLEGVFPGVDVGYNTQSAADSLAAEMDALTLKSTFSKGWPGWRSLRKYNEAPSEETLEYTLKMDNRYKTYVKLQAPKDEFNVEDSFRLATECIKEIRAQLSSESSAESSKVIDSVLAIDMARAVYGSNFIEQAGKADLNETIKLCLMIFEGKEIGVYKERDTKYAARLEALVRKGTDPDQRDELRSRREIIQHAVAFQHIVNAVVKRDERITEDLIKETHRILTDGIASAGGKSSAKYSGSYRNVTAFAGSTEFPKPSKVPAAMSALVRDLNEDIAKAEACQEMDPFFFAARYCDRFVNVHPFADGNGRICRLIMNALLLRYAGIIVSLGKKDGERDDYLQIAMESSKSGGWPDKLGTMVLAEATATLKKLRIALTKSKQV